MPDSKGKSWWEENVEDPHWEQRNKERALYKDNPLGQVQHDIGVGVEKGIYYGAKDMAVGLLEVAKWAVLLVAHDPETEKATAEAVVTGAKGAWGLAKDVAAAEYGTPEQKRDVNDRWAKSVSDLGNAVADKVKKDWDEASKQGKQAELVSKYASRVGFEAAALLVGAGEASAVAKAGEAVELASGLSKAEKLGAGVSECAATARAVDRTGDAAKAVRALEQAGAGATNALKEAGQLEYPNSALADRFTGARQLKNTDFKGAEAAYEEIRKSTTDVSAIAKNANMSETRVQRIKDHVFDKTHVLDDATRRFDADPEIANAWRRLEGGTHTQSDVQLLEHELFESKFEGIFKTDYRTSHKAANRSGRTSGLE